MRKVPLMALTPMQRYAGFPLLSIRMTDSALARREIIGGSFYVLVRILCTVAKIPIPSLSLVRQFSMRDNAHLFATSVTSRGPSSESDRKYQLGLSSRMVGLTDIARVHNSASARPPTIGLQLCHPALAHAHQSATANI
jgi:hypothetical protein